VEVRDPAKLPEIVAEAFHVAMSGRRGPVVVSLPEDIQLEKVCAPDVAPKAVAHPAPAPARMNQLAQMLGEAKKPLVLLGGSGWSAESRAQLQAFAERQNLPVVTSFRRIDLFDNTHPCYAGNISLGVDPKLVQRIKDADVILAVGSRLGDIVTAGYTLLDPPKPKQTLIHVHPDAADLNRVYQTRLAIHSAMDAFGVALAAMPALKGAWTPWAAAARADYEAFIVPKPVPGAVDLATIFSELPRRLPADAVITNGAGNYTGWHSRYFMHRNFRTYAGPTSGAMGYGVPAAVAAKAVFPERTVIALAGDGCFMMAAQELATAHQYNLPIIVLVLNNGMYGTIRMHQERHYPERTIATNLMNPDFAALARAYGGHGETVTTTAEFWPALERARASGKVAVIDIKMDPEAITTGTTLSAITAKAKS
jgi:acetolactate synthase-1/2/3 large subunit